MADAKQEEQDRKLARNYYEAKFSHRLDEWLKADAPMTKEWQDLTGMTGEQLNNVRHLYWDSIPSGGGQDMGLHYAFNSGNIKKAISQALEGNAADAAKGAEAEAASAEQASKDKAAADRNDVTGRIQKFIDALTPNVAPDDPVRLGLMQAGMDAAQANAGARGVRGGLANTAAASVAQANVLPYLAQRQQQYEAQRLQGLDLLNNRDLSLGQLAQGYAQLEQEDRHFAQNRNDMIAGGQWKAQMGQSQGIGGAIGTGLGALGFIGGPALGAATMAGGGAVGGAFGGMLAPQQSPNYGSYQPRSHTPYRGLGGNGTGF